MNYGLMNVKARQRELILSKPKHKYNRYSTQKNLLNHSWMKHYVLTIHMHDNPRLTDGSTHAAIRHVNITSNPIPEASPCLFVASGGRAAADVSSCSNGLLDQVAATLNCERLANVTIPWTDLSAAS